jgi:hypothetical protein
MTLEERRVYKCLGEKNMLEGMSVTRNSEHMKKKKRENAVSDEGKPEMMEANRKAQTENEKCDL